LLQNSASGNDVSAILKLFSGADCADDTDSVYRDRMDTCGFIKRYPCNPRLPPMISPPLLAGISVLARRYPRFRPVISPSTPSFSHPQKHPLFTPNPPHFIRERQEKSYFLK